jgi:hypothetical protein
MPNRLPGNRVGGKRNQANLILSKFYVIKIHALIEVYDKIAKNY